MVKNNKKIIFWGTPEFAVPSLKSLHSLGLVKLVVTQTDKPAGRNQQVSLSPVKQYAVQNKLSVLQADKLDEKFIAELKKYLPATFVVVAYGRIIPEAVLDLSELVAINLHPSRLPELRGPSPIQTALLRGFKTTAVSLMQLDKKMDHGPILGQIKANISPTDDFLGLSGKLSQLGAQLLAEKIKAYLAGQIEAVAQDDNGASFCKLINKTDGEISWSKTALEIYNQVRAFNPWPSTYTKFGDLNVKILKVKVIKQNLKPKEIFIDKDKLIVGTSVDALEILEVQPAGKKNITAAEFIRGYHRYLSK